MVLHATSNMTVEENVAYETRGHCFIVEEGGEVGNLFRRNLGFSTRAGEQAWRGNRCDGLIQSMPRRSYPCNFLSPAQKVPVAVLQVGASNCGLLARVCCELKSPALAVHEPVPYSPASLQLLTSFLRQSLGLKPTTSQPHSGYRMARMTTSTMWQLAQRTAGRKKMAVLNPVSVFIHTTIHLPIDR